MSDDTQQKETQENKPAASSEPQPGSHNAPAGTEEEKKRTLKGAGLKYTREDGVPSWAVGKTADEILRMTQTLHDTYLQGGTPPQDAQPNTIQREMNQNMQSAPQQNQSQAPSPPDPNLMFTNAAEYNRQLSEWNQYQINQSFQAQSAPFMQGQIELAKAESRRDSRFKEVWERYEPEIEAEVSRVNPQMKTSVKFWNQAAALIKGMHFDELHASRMNETRPTDTGTLSTDGSFSQNGNTSSSLSPIEKAWREDADWIKSFKRLPGMSAAKLRSQVAQMGSTEEDYVSHYESKNAFRIHNSDEELARAGVL